MTSTLVSRSMDPAETKHRSTTERRASHRVAPEPEPEPEAPPLRILHAKAAYMVKGEDTSRSCSIELVQGIVVQFYAVFDGHGGARASRFAAEHMPALLASNYAAAEAAAEGDSRAERLRAACKKAFVQLEQQFIRTSSHSDGTTATCVIIDGDEVTVANVGDSAAMLYLESGEAIMLSTDHRVGRRSPEENRRIIDAGAQIGRIRGRDGNPVGPERIYPGGLSVTRSIGDSDSTSAAISEPDVHTITIPPEGGMIVMASDGVWDFVEESHIERLAATSRKPKCGAGWLSRAMMRTVNQANVEIDDATLLCIEMRPAGADDPAGSSSAWVGTKMKNKALSMFGFGPKDKEKPDRGAQLATPMASSESDSDGSNHPPAAVKRGAK
jgi:serine/threonine protein phosphatase PrpC